MKHNTTFRLILICIGIAMSLVVMLGWLIESRVIVQIHPDFHPMQFNTALGFVLLNTALLALHFGRVRLSIVLASQLILLFTLTLLEHLFEVQIGIDTLFVEPFVTQEHAAPGRPGANTSVCFWLMGVAVWMYSLELKQLGLWIVSIATIVLGMSLSSIWGYAEGLHELTSWSPYFSGMAVHTSVVFLFASLVMLSLKLTHAMKREGSLYAFRPVHASILLLIMTLTIWNAMRQWDRERIHRELTRYSESVSSSIRLGFVNRFNAFTRLSHRWESEPGFTPASWLADSQNYIEDMPALVMLRLQADNLLLQRLGATIDSPLADRVVLDGAAQTSSVMQIDDRSFLVVRIALARDGEPIGQLMCVMDLETWVLGYATDRWDGLHVALLYDEQVVFEQKSEQPTDDRFYASAPLELPDFPHPFEFRLVPTSGYIAAARSPWSLAILIGGVIAASVLWLILKQAIMLIRSRQEIRQQAIEIASKSSQLAKANADLIEQNREMEHLNRAISHDLHSPLFSIKNYLSLLRNNWRDGNLEDNNEYIGRVSHIADRMSGTIDSLLAVSAVKRSDSRHVCVRLRPLISDVLAYIEGDVQVADAEIEVEEDLHDVVGDPVLLGNILQNLISNATKHARVPDQQLRIHIGTQVRGEMICLFVEDNGHGIEQEFRETIFDPFRRGDKTTVPGTGIGLSIVSRGVRVHGGEAWIEDSPLGGARFCVTLPAASSQARAIAEQV